MNDIEVLAARFGGVLTAQQMVECGVTREEIRKWTGSRINRVRNGWFEIGPADTRVKRAVNLGGVLACGSVLRIAGVWIPDTDLHTRFESRRRVPGVRNCIPYGTRPSARVAIDPIGTALASAVNCYKPEDIVVIVDSMLNRKMIDLAEARTVLAASRHAHLDLASMCDARAESGIESYTRLRLRRAGVRPVTQVQIEQIARVDLLIGRRLIIECDGREYHEGQFEADRERDRKLIARGYIVIRLTHDQVMLGWDDALADILHVIRRRDHRKPPKPVD